MRTLSDFERLGEETFPIESYDVQVSYGLFKSQISLFFFYVALFSLYDSLYVFSAIFAEMKLASMRKYRFFFSFFLHSSSAFNPSLDFLAHF